PAFTSRRGDKVSRGGLSITRSHTPQSFHRTYHVGLEHARPLSAMMPVRPPVRGVQYQSQARSHRLAGILSCPDDVGRQRFAGVVAGGDARPSATGTPVALAGAALSPVVHDHPALSPGAERSIATPDRPL